MNFSLRTAEHVRKNLQFHEKCKTLKIAAIRAGDDSSVDCDYYIIAKLSRDKLRNADVLAGPRCEGEPDLMDVVIIPLDDRDYVKISYLAELIEKILIDCRRYHLQLDGCTPKVMLSISGSEKDVTYYHIYLDDWVSVRGSTDKCPDRSRACSAHFPKTRTQV